MGSSYDTSRDIWEELSQGSRFDLKKKGQTISNKVGVEGPKKEVTDCMDIITASMTQITGLRQKNN